MIHYGFNENAVCQKATLDIGRYLRYEGQFLNFLVEKKIDNGSK
jgi:hypothetical protein